MSGSPNSVDVWASARPSNMPSNRRLGWSSLALLNPSRGPKASSFLSLIDRWRPVGGSGSVDSTLGAPAVLTGGACVPAGGFRRLDFVWKSGFHQYVDISLLAISNIYVLRLQRLIQSHIMYKHWDSSSISYKTVLFSSISPTRRGSKNRLTETRFKSLS